MNNFPNGNAAAGTYFLRDYNEYIGCKLNSTMLSGTSYQLTLNIAAINFNPAFVESEISNIGIYEPVNITIFGCNNGNNFPLNTLYSPNLVDPTWIEIGHALYTPNSKWGELTLLFTPSIDINAIMIGPPSVLPISYPVSNSENKPYFLFDNLLLNTAATFFVNISQSGDFCNNNLVLNANITTVLDPIETYQWYFNGVEINGATEATYTVPYSTTSLGDYTVKVSVGESCYLSSIVTVNDAIVSPSYTIIQPSCSIPTGTVTITTLAYQYSFDNGITWQNSPTKDLLPTGTHYIKIKSINECISSSQGVTILQPQLSIANDYTVTQPTYCGGTGTITITSTLASEYSFDNGLTWTTNPVASNLIPDIYYIKIRNGSGCESPSLMVSVNPVFLPNPTYAITNATCDDGATITITTVASEYSFDGGATWTTNPIALNLSAGNYPIKIRNSLFCESDTIIIAIAGFTVPNPQYTISNAGCETYGSITITSSADLYSFDGGITWSTNATISNLIGGETYSLVIKRGNCISATVTTTITSQFYLNPNAHNYELALCDSMNNDSEIVDLTQYNSFLIANSSDYNFSYFISYSGAETYSLSQLITNYSSYSVSNSSNKVYVRVKSNTNCYTIVELLFNLINSPNLEIQDNYSLCENRSVEINAGSGFDSYLWSTGETSQIITANQPGDYWIMVTENHGSLICDSTKQFTLLNSYPPTITSIDTLDWSDTENSITINTNGLGSYEYSIDGVHFQDSNSFYGPWIGEYTVYVRDKNGCGTTEDSVYLLNYPKYFTPNSDGINDFWRIQFSELEPNLSSVIYDRFGKLIAILAVDSIGWDGKLNGNILPSDDYWFVVTRENGKIYKGHFALKR